MSLFKHLHVNILIAEDMPFSMLLTKTVCKLLLPEASVFEAVDGAEALRIFSQTSPQLALLDVNMPELSGYEVARHIRAADPDKRILIIGTSAGLLNAERNQCIESGMDDYICKPILQESLEVMLQKWLPAKGLR